ncbi:MAG: hypothetical protein J0L97_00225 [Alphaproteobacteria bacterium]|nr:hypothetical protein [Alphaproteobacteria bacterium]
MDQRILLNALQTAPRDNDETDVQFVERVSGEFITKYKRSFDTFLEADGAIREGAAVNDEKLKVFRQALRDRLEGQKERYEWQLAFHDAIQRRDIEVLIELGHSDAAIERLLVELRKERDALNEGVHVNGDREHHESRIHELLGKISEAYHVGLPVITETGVGLAEGTFISTALANTGLDSMKGLAQEIYDRKRAAEILEGMNQLQHQLLDASGNARADLDSVEIARILSDYGLFTMLGQLMSDPHEVARQRALLPREVTDALGLPPEDARDHLQINRAIAAGQLTVKPLKEELLKILGSEEEVEKWIAFSLTCGYSAIAGSAFNEAIRGVTGGRTLEDQQVSEAEVLRIIQNKFQQEPVIVFAALVHHLQNFCLLNLSGGAFDRREGEPSPLYAALKDPSQRDAAMERLRETQLWKAVTAPTPQAREEASKAVAYSEYRGESLEDVLEHYKKRAVNLMVRLGISPSEGEAWAEIDRQLHAKDPANAAISDILLLQEWLERRVRGVSAEALVKNAEAHERLYGEDLRMRGAEIDRKLALLGTAEEPGKWGRSQIFQEFQSQLEETLRTAVEAKEERISSFLSENFSAADEERIRRALLKARDVYYGHKMSAVGFTDTWDYVHHFVVHAMIREGVGDLYPQVRDGIGQILVETFSTRATSPSEAFEEIVRTTYFEAYTALWKANQAQLIREDTPEFDAYASAIDKLLRAGYFPLEKKEAIVTEFARARERFYEAKLENPLEAKVESYVWQALGNAQPAIDQAELGADFEAVQQEALLIARKPHPRTAYRNLPAPGELLENIHREGGGINAIEIVFHRLPPEIVAQMDVGVKPAIEQKSMELMGVLFSTDSAAGLPGVGGHRHRSREYLMKLDPATIERDSFMGFDVPKENGTKRVSTVTRWQPDPSGKDGNVAVVYGCSAADGNLNDSAAYALLASMQATPELLALFCPEESDIIRLGVQAAPNYNAAINPLNDRILARSGHMLRLLDGQANPLHNRYELRLPGAMANAYDVETGMTIFDLLANANQYADFIHAHKGNVNQTSSSQIVEALADLKALASESAVLRPHMENAESQGYGFAAALHAAKVELFSDLQSVLGEATLRSLRSGRDLLAKLHDHSDQLSSGDLLQRLNEDYGNSLPLLLDLMVKFHNHDMAVIALLDAPEEVQRKQAALLADLVDAGYVKPGDYAARLRGEGEYAHLIRRENGELRELMYDGVPAGEGKLAVPHALADSYRAAEGHAEVVEKLNESKSSETGLMHIVTKHALSQAKDEGRQHMAARMAA